MGYVDRASAWTGSPEATSCAADARPIVVPARPGCGLFSMVFHVLGACSIAARAERPVWVYLGRDACFWDPDRANAWEPLFAPVGAACAADVGLRDARALDGLSAGEIATRLAFHADVMVAYPWDEVGAFGIPGHTTPAQLARLLDAGRRWLRVRPEVAADVAAFAAGAFADAPRVVGVHYRGTDKYIEAPLTAFARYVDALDAELAADATRVFVATDDGGFLDACVARYGAHRIRSTAAMRSRDGRPVHLTGGASAAAECLRDALLLAGCDVLYHGHSNVIGGVAIFNPELPRVDLAAGA